MRTVLRDIYIVLFFLPDKLTQEYDALQNKTFTYTYDGNGNILSVAETGGATKTYVYGDANWGDLLTSYDGQTITYDAIGNPLSYLGATLTWQNGRRLASYVKGTDSITYTYNAEGMRTSKTVNGVTTDYVYDGSTLLAQKVGNDWMYFFYDADGILGFLYNNCAYYYAKNLQGDVLSVLDSYGLTVCEYTYDSWGKLITVTDDSGNAVTDSTHIALLNPIRYRGYLYDSETGFYYLQSRYYNPEVKRFVNGDAYVATGQGMLGNNMFAYCGNNPIIRADTSGQLWGLIVLGALVIGGAFVLSGCSSRASSSTYSPPSSYPPSSKNYSSTHSNQYIDSIISNIKPPIEVLVKDKEFVELAATVAGEALSCDPLEMQACAQVIMNRVGNPTWSDYGNHSIIGVVSAKGQFGGYNSNNYKAMIRYIEEGMPSGFDEPGIGTAADFNEVLENVMLVYNGDAENYIGNATMFQKSGRPAMAGKQVYIPGIKAKHVFFVHKNDL